LQRAKERRNNSRMISLLKNNLSNEVELQTIKQSLKYSKLIIVDNDDYIADLIKKGVL
jgi:hypothetical protein